MTEQPLTAGCLVLYKSRPALVTKVDKKIDLALEGGETLSVRPKDVVVLHPGPVERWHELAAPAGEVLAAWELLAGQRTTLAELAELAYGDFTPSTAWAAWQVVTDGLYFTGTPDAIVGRTATAMAEEQAARQAKAAEEQAWAEFLARVQQRRWAPEDGRYLREVEDLALGRRGDSRVLRELGRGQTPQNAHALLLDLAYWDAFVDPYPSRLEVPTASAEAHLPVLAAEERLDLTHLPAFAIDDAGNTDPDDAVSLEGRRLWVHVADVAALVPPDSPADLEARGRGANLYLPEGTITMLPPSATAQLGLGLAEVSPALSFGLDLDGEGEIAAITVTPSWVRVTRLTYDEVEGRLEEPSFAGLYRLAEANAARRRRYDAVSLDLPEVKIAVEEGRVHIQPLAAGRSRQLVAEAMLLAGEAAARFAFENGIALPFTVQDPPSAPAADYPDTLSGMFARRRTLQRSQQSSVPGQHSGLGLALYARATSPLRRYLDLVVHQQLRAFARREPLLDGQEVLERVGAAEAVAYAVRQAERLARQHWTIVYLQQNPDWQGDAILVDKAGLRGTLLIPDLGWETRLQLRDDLPLDSMLRLAVRDVNLPHLDVRFRVVSA